MGPGALPGIAQLNGRRRSARDHHWNQKHRRRSLHLHTLDAEERRGLRPVELDSKVGDVAGGTDLLALDVDRADNLVERSIRQRRRVVRRCIVHLGPQHPEALTLRDAPPRIARALGIGAADVDVNTADFQGV